MILTAISAIIVFAALSSFSILSLRASRRRDQWQSTMAFGVATAATLIWVVSRQWGLGLPTALLASILATEIAFLIFLVKTRDVLALGIILGPYLLMAGALVVWADLGSGTEALLPQVDGWLAAHIGAAILSYGFVTLGAIAGIAIILRERALQRRTRGKLTDSLPAVSIAESIEILGLTAAELVLGMAILFGIVAEYTASGTYFQVTHKSLLSVIAFALIGLLLLFHLKTGLRGRQAARLCLTAYLLISLGYPGVKFVGEFILT